MTSEKNKALLTATNVSQSYGKAPVLKGVSLEINRGEVVALIGPNGAGKSTLLRCLLGFDPDAQGEVWLQGKPLAELDRRAVARTAAFVPQFSPSDIDFAVRDVVAMGRTPHLGRFGRETAKDVDAITKALAFTECTSLADRNFSELSGGEQKRVMVARGLCQDANLLLLDEPTASLDPRHAHQLMGLIRKIVTDSGRGVLVAIHDLSLAARHADRMLVLSETMIYADGTPKEVLTEEMLRDVFGIETQLVTEEKDIFVLVRGASSDA